MGKYTFMMTHEDGTMSSVSGNKEGITEVFEDFELFLAGAGFSPSNIADLSSLSCSAVKSDSVRGVCAPNTY